MLKLLKDAHKYPGVVDDFFEVMAIIDAAIDERELYALPTFE